MKTCSKCLIFKEYSLFSKDKSKKDGYCTICKDCARENRKRWYSENKDRVKEYQSNYEKENRDAVKERAAKWRHRNREHHLEKRRSYHKLRYESDIRYRMDGKIRSMLKRTLKAIGMEKDFATFKKLGYTPEQLKLRIEFQFKNGMSWDNIGEWEIDHKIPIPIMTAKGEFRPEIINCLSNLQPLWKKENRSKGARYIG